MTRRLTQKEAGAYYTPDVVADSLLHWAIRSASDRLLDPSCGNGQFIRGHKNSVGIEQDAIAAKQAVDAAPAALVHEGDFFAWARNTLERFECAAGNPPFIRYQRFVGPVRESALAICSKVGAHFSGLASSWAPFLVAATTLLRPGGRIAFVVPAEIGHAPYSAPLIEYLASHFAVVHVVAIRSKLFPTLSEDCWLLYADGFGGHTEDLRFSALNRFRRMTSPPQEFVQIPLVEWRTSWNRRLRPFLIASGARKAYLDIVCRADTRRLGDLAAVGIGYVTGANDFFHLRPSQVRALSIPEKLLHPTVRNGRALPAYRLTTSVVAKWRRDDEQMMLLRIPKGARVPAPVKRYLDSEAGHTARSAYKCRVRDPWYSVPDVQIPDFFLSYMSGRAASLVRNDAACTCTNSVHAVRLREGVEPTALRRSWESSFTNLSCEIEGHPLGGGMLKLEPREAGQIVFPAADAVDRIDREMVNEAVFTLREWRHYATSN
jgi:adenine-specific DNA methylase